MALVVAEFTSHVQFFCWVRALKARSSGTAVKTKLLRE